MNIDEYGYFYLRCGNNNGKLFYKNNFVTIDNGMNITETPTARALFSISIDDVEIVVMNLNQDIYVNGVFQTTPLFSVKENDRITVNNYEFQLMFDVNSTLKLNQLLDMFLDGTLPEYFDVQRMFVKYAQDKHITNKQAAIILASIDVPELDITT